MNLENLSKIVQSGAAFRSRIRIQPAGGEGDKVFPPTYLGANNKASYATEKRVVNLDGKPTSVDCVLLDSVQSQANRMEEALQQAIDEGRLQVPLVEVDFTKTELIDPIGKITSLQAPHRVADALLRDAELDGVPFRKSSVGMQLDAVSNRNATPLYEICPTALVFGMWDSTGPKGGLGAKFARALVSEIVGFGIGVGSKTSSRIDPAQIRAQAKVVEDKDGGWHLAGAKDKKAKSPSEINHGNIPPTIDDITGGVTLEYAEQITVISLPALRRLRFPVNGEYKPEYDQAARAVLMCLGLVSVALANDAGLDLRSRCVLWPESSPKWEVLGKPGTDVDTVEIDSEKALALYSEAVAVATGLGLPYLTEPVSLLPGKSLAALLQRSQELAAAGEAEDE